MMEGGKFTTEESIAALSLTVEEIKELERNPVEDNDLPSFGKYGSLFLNYLRENHQGRHAFLLGETALRDICAQVDNEAREMMETIKNQIRAKNPRPKGDFMATVQYEMAIRDQAEEFVLRKIVYRRR